MQFWLSGFSSARFRHAWAVESRKSKAKNQERERLKLEIKKSKVGSRKLAGGSYQSSGWSRKQPRPSLLKPRILNLTPRTLQDEFIGVDGTLGRLLLWGEFYPSGLEQCSISPLKWDWHVVWHPTHRLVQSCSIWKLLVPYVPILLWKIAVPRSKSLVGSTKSKGARGSGEETILRHRLRADGGGLHVPVSALMVSSDDLNLTTDDLWLMTDDLRLETFLLVGSVFM